MNRAYIMTTAVLMGSALVGAGSLVADAGCGACGPPPSKMQVKAACCPNGTPAEKQCAKCQLKAKSKGCKTCAAGQVCKGKCSPKGAAASSAPKSGGHNISTETLKALLDSGVKVTVLDARGGKWDDGRRIPGATGLPADSEEKAIRKAAGDKDGLVVTYCTGVKCPASTALARKLGELGYENVLEYPLGIEGWSAAGEKVDKR